MAELPQYDRQELIVSLEPDSDRLELDEREIWEGSDPVIADAADEESEDKPVASVAVVEAADSDASDSSSESDLSEQATNVIAAFRGEGDPRSCSTQDSPMVPSSSPRSASTDANPIAVPSPRSSRHGPSRERGQRRHVFGVQSLPVSNIQMGSSAPINIPRMAAMGAKHFRMGPHKRDLENRQAATFIPPHLLEQAQASAAAASGADLYTGVSPSASLKREKLMQRNAILRRTGFIESSIGREPSMEPIREHQLETLLQGPSALSQALGTSPAMPHLTGP